MSRALPRAFASRHAVIIVGPARTRDPAMHQAKKGKQWHFGMKAHIGVDADSGLVHTLVTTPANVHDVTQAHALLQARNATQPATPAIRAWASRHLRLLVRGDACRPAPAVGPVHGGGSAARCLRAHQGALRAKVEHPFHIIKNLFKSR